MSVNSTNFSTKMYDDDARYIREKYPDKVPILLIPLRQNSKLAYLRLLVPKDLSFSHFIASVRRRLSMTSETGLYFYIGSDKTITTVNTLISHIDLRYTSKDGFVYVYYDLETSFGSNSY
jgi:hypothetical protein